MNYELNLNEPVVINSSSNITTEVVYNKTKQTQLIEILKISASWVIGGLGILFFNDFIFSDIKKNKILYIITFLIIFLSVIYVASYVFTYLKVINDKDDVIDKLTEVNLE